MFSTLIYLLVRSTLFPLLLLFVHLKVFFCSIDADPISPDIIIQNCTFGEKCTGAINSSSVHYYSVEYSFDPSMVRSPSFLTLSLDGSFYQAVRVITNMTYDVNQESPLLIVVRQIRGVISWVLPYTFPNG